MKLFLMLCLVALLTGCVHSTLVHSESVELSLEQAREHWSAMKLNSYEYEVTRLCFCAPGYTRSMRVRVSDGVVVSAIYTDDQMPVASEVLKSLNTIDGWFDLIAKGYEKPYFSVRVQFHPRQGYPQELFMDRNERVADDEQTVIISAVKAPNF